MKTNISVKLIVMLFIVVAFVFGGCQEAIDQVTDAIVDSSADLSSLEKVATDDSMNLISSIAQDIVPNAAAYTTAQTSETMTVGGREVQAKVTKTSTGTGSTTLEVEFPASEDISGTVVLEVNTDDGTWSMSSKDETTLSFTTEDETGKTGQSKIKYENTKVNAEGEIQEGIVKVDDKELETELMKAMNKLNKISAMVYEEILSPDRTTNFLDSVEFDRTTTFEGLDKDGNPLSGITQETPLTDSEADLNWGYETNAHIKFAKILNEIDGKPGEAGRKLKETTTVNSIVAKQTFTTTKGVSIEFEMDIDQSNEMEITFDADGKVTATKYIWKTVVNSLKGTVDGETIVFSDVVLTMEDDDITDGVDSAKGRWVGTITVGGYEMSLETMPFRLLTKMFEMAVAPNPRDIDPMESTWDSIDPDMQTAILKMLTLKDEINTNIIPEVGTLTTGDEKTFTDFGKATIMVEAADSPGVKKITLAFKIDETIFENNRGVYITTFADSYALSGLLDTKGSGTARYLLMFGSTNDTTMSLIVDSNGDYSDGILSVVETPKKVDSKLTTIPVTAIPTSTTN